MKTYQTITAELADDIAVLRLNRPDSMNALTNLMRAELTDAVPMAAKEARVVVITGEGRAFCAGQDLSDGRAAEAPDLERVLRDEYGPLMGAITHCPVPTIAAVNGAAAGAGANLALLCDVVIAKESAFFLEAFTRIGLIPDAGGTYWLPRMMGSAKAMGAALFAEKIPARQAEEWGMIWEAVPDTEFENQWRSRAAHLAKGPTAAYASLKQAVRQSWGNTMEQQLDLEAKLQGACGKSRDFREGVLAFLDKRSADFEGR